MHEHLRHKEPGYNILHEPWVETTTTTGQVRILSLAETFEQAHQLSGLSFHDPAAELGTYRLLLAIIYAALDAPKKGKDAPIMEYPLPQVKEYLDKHEDEFYLYHPTNPFFQSDYLLTAKTDLKTPDALGIHVYGGQGKIVSSRDYYLPGETMDPAEALRSLLGMNLYAKGQVYGPTPSWASSQTQSASSGSFAGNYAVLPLAGTLAQTLLLNLVPAEAYDLGKPWWSLTPEERQSYVETPLRLLTRPTKNHYLLPDEQGNVQYLLRGAEKFDQAAYINDIHLPTFEVEVKKTTSDEPDLKERRPVRSKLELWRDVASFVTSEKGSPAVRYALNNPEWDEDAKEVLVYGCDSNSTELPTYQHRRKYPIPINQIEISELLEELTMALLVNNLVQRAYLSALGKNQDEGKFIEGMKGKPDLLKDQLSALSEELVLGYVTKLSTRAYSVEEENALFNQTLEQFKARTLEAARYFVQGEAFMVQANFMNALQGLLTKTLAKHTKETA